MNPARSPITTGALPSCSTSATTSVTTSGSVTTDRMTSTSFNTCVGLKKCMPTTLPGRPVCTPISVIDSDDVLDANTVSGPQIPSSAANTAALSSIRSGTASTTRSHSARSASSVVVVIRPSSTAFPASSSLPRATARDVECSRWPSPRARPSSFTSTAITVRPVRASTSAIPAPIVPSPTTPTVLNWRATTTSRATATER